jgi:DUF4097 and DUF4098 domain-containing protein YvlB
VSGSIIVKGANVKDVVLETKGRSGEDDEDEKPARQGNLHRIPMGGAGYSVESENNQIRISASPQKSSDMVLTVPVHTSLSLHTVNGGDINVTGVDGEIDVNNVNGSVTLKDIAGSAVAHALNGRLTASFTRVDPQKAMSFSSLNGNIDVTFPPDIKATVIMRSDRGEVYSDFDIQLQANSPPAVEDQRHEGKGRYVVRVERTVRGNINGGGQEIQFKNFNGNIYIRKGGK